MYKAIFIISLLIIFPALADQATDKAEFEKLYSKYMDLYQNSDNLDDIIDTAEKVYKLAPKIYGRKSENYAVVTYNLAGHYDEKGGEEENEFELKASDLYRKYFRLQNLRKVPHDKAYIDQYISYIFAYYNSHPFNAKGSIGDDLLKVAYSLELSNLELANLEYFVAILRAKAGRLKNSIPHFEKSLNRYTNEFGADHFKVGEILIWLAKYDMLKRKDDVAIDKLLKAANVFEHSLEETDELRLTVYSDLNKLYETSA